MTQDVGSLSLLTSASTCDIIKIRFFFSPHHYFEVAPTPELRATRNFLLCNWFYPKKGLAREISIIPVQGDEKQTP